MCEAYGRVCPYAAKQAGLTARKYVDRLFEDSVLFHNDALDFDHRFDYDDLKIGALLGTGGFSNVHACSIPSLSIDTELAVKTLRRQCMCDSSVFRHGAADLAVEAHFLQTLRHNHIAKLHGVPSGCIFDSFAGGNTHGYFLVIDRLYDTLEKRILQWALEQEKHSGNLLTRRTADFREHKRLELMERLRVSFSIADAMEYLHGKNIVYRDLKPDNCGFDKEGVVKLFDFGLAKELKPSRSNGLGQYVLSGNTGSRRYMAPEVAKTLPYNTTVDVYSFGILLWEVCSTEKPFFEYSCAKHMQRVVLGGERPLMDAKHTTNWPLSLQWLMTRCWSSDPTERPTFTIVKETLRDILTDKAMDAPSLPPTSSVAMPLPAILSSIKPLTPNDRTRAKTWGFTLRKKAT
jgi:serine/threonine protein kinase